MQVLGCLKAFKPFHGIADSAPTHYDRARSDKDVILVGSLLLDMIILPSTMVSG